jgi:NADH dehydrogenase
VSAIGADPASPSIYSSTKGEGERRVREAFPSATIIRPSLVFGQEDQLTNRFAGMAKRAFLPVLAPGTRFQPVWVGDLARAIAVAATNPEAYGGRTFEIGGPQVMTMRELNQETAELAGQDPEIVDLPDFVGDLMSRAGFLPGAPLTRDQWLMLQRDNVASGPGLEAFGIEPTPLGTIGQEWLGRFRKGGRFASRNAQATAG